LIRPLIQFKPIEGYASATDADLRKEWANGAIKEVLIHP